MYVMRRDAILIKISIKCYFSIIANYQKSIFIRYLTSMISVWAMNSRSLPECDGQGLSAYRMLLLLINLLFIKTSKLFDLTTTLYLSYLFSGKTSTAGHCLPQRSLQRLVPRYPRLMISANLCQNVDPPCRRTSGSWSSFEYLTTPAAILPTSCVPCPLPPGLQSFGLCRSTIHQRPPLGC